MAMVKKIACFFTGGYTESNAMPIFLKKINPDIEFRQFCPNRTKRRKRPGQLDLIDEVSGLTGPALLGYVYTYLKEHPKEIAEFDAILIEDDLDGRFYEETVPGEEKSIVAKRTADFEKHYKEIRENICERLGKDDSFPVLRLFAAPEIEAWFLADWEDTFSFVYGPKSFSVLTTGECDFFSTRFWSYIKEGVLMGYADRIEEYGYFSGVYKKLSDEIIAAFDSFKVSLASPKEKSPYAETIAAKRDLRYSKKLHGDEMLRRSSPDKIREKCTIYFRETYDQLKSL